MPTLFYSLTNEPTDIVDAMSLSVGTTYQGQYNGPSILRARAIDAVDPDPASDSLGLEVGPRRTFTIIPASDEKIFVWTVSAGGTLVIDVVP